MTIFIHGSHHCMMVWAAAMQFVSEYDRFGTVYPGKGMTERAYSGGKAFRLIVFGDSRTHLVLVAFRAWRPLATLEQIWNSFAYADSYFRPRRARA
jgi:hypothetical protein